MQSFSQGKLQSDRGPGFWGPNQDFGIDKKLFHVRFNDAGIPFKNSARRYNFLTHHRQRLLLQL